MSLTYGPGEYVLNEPIVLDRPGDAVLGAGIDATVLRYTGTGPAIVNSMPAGESEHWGLRIGGFTLRGGGIELDRSYFGHLHDLRILEAPGFACRLYHAGGTTFAAYNVLERISASLGTGNGIVLDAGSECNSVRDCNASYFTSGAVPATHYADPLDLSAGIGFLVASSNNWVSGGHMDRCTYPLVVAFGDSNRLDTAADNALVHAVVLKAATQTSGQVAVGRMDPTLPDGTPNPRYGLANWAAVHATNISAGNRLELRFRKDTSPPPLPVGRSSWPRGGWSVAIWENGGTGQSAYGGANRWVVMPEGQLAYKLDGLGAIIR